MLPATSSLRSQWMGAAVEISNVSKSFGDLRALAPVDLSIESGEVVTLLGPSGCGKTTLLRLISGLTAPTTGSISIDGRSPEAARRDKRIGFVPQAPALLPWRSVRANAELLLDVNRGTGHSGAARPSVSVDELLDSVGLSEFADARPHELSGGMQQRVGLVRAFALDAPLLVMDEPFAALGELTRSEMRHLLNRLREPSGATVVFVTHSVSEAVHLSDRVAVLSPRPGSIVDVHSIDLARPRAADVEDSSEFFVATVELRRSLTGGPA